MLGCIIVCSAVLSKIGLKVKGQGTHNHVKVKVMTMPYMVKEGGGDSLSTSNFFSFFNP